MARRSTRHWLPEATERAESGTKAVALNGLGHLQAFWRADLVLPPIKRFLAGLGAAAWA
jgi:hypothetical protein